MIDIKLIRADPEKFKKAAKDKNIIVDIDRLLVVDRLLRQAKQKAQENAIIKNQHNKNYE